MIKKGYASRVEMERMRNEDDGKPIYFCHV